MESAAILIDGGEWSSFNGVSVNEEADFMAKLFSSSSLCNELEMSSSLSLSSSFYSGHEPSIGMVESDSSFYTTDTDSNLYSLSQGSSLSGSSDNVAYQCHENYYLSDTDQLLAVNGSSMPIEFCLDTKGCIQVFPGNPIERNPSLQLEMSCDNLDEPEADLTQPQNSSINTKHEMSEIEHSEEEKSSDSSEGGRKRSRNSVVQKGKRNVRSKRSRKLVSEDEDNSPALNTQNSSSSSSEEELSGGNLDAPADDTPSVKTRASRGSATDPQSLYARKRREKINERLRILQRLVTNGTKVDISTMLEEAVHYVKFLQLQIKLLSSDDLWMFAPLAYNGMDIGLESKINSLL